MDLFVAPTIGFDLLYVLVIVRLERRNLVWINVTPHPTAEWIARQVTEAFPWAEAPRYLIRDRDRVYGAAVTHRLRAMGIRHKPIAPGSPWQNGFAERLIGSIRRECVDHVIVLGEAHLRRILTRYAAYYNELRTHRSRGKDASISRAIQHVGRIISGPSLADFITIIAEFILPNLVFGTDNGAKRPPHEGTRQVSHSQIDHLSELGDVRVLLLQQLNNARRVAVVQRSFRSARSPPAAPACGSLRRPHW